MAYPYDATNNYSAYVPPSEPDEISLFLQQFLFSTPNRHAPVENQQPGMFPGPGRISVRETSSGIYSSSGGWFPANVSSSSIGTFENDTDEYDCESEEGIEALVEEASGRPTYPRNSSKRSRAAEVHNLSEKRRRSRINEKMKALQNLIPNSNKTDKASMLDEAIEYLKQLQLQVQMLTMRNGLSVYPVCLPRMFQSDQISEVTLDMFQRNKSVNISTAKPVHNTNLDISADNLSSAIGSKDSFDMESSLQNHLVPFQQFSRGIHCRQSNEECSRTRFLPVAKSKSSVAFDTEPSASEDNTLEACLLDENAHNLPNLLNFPVFSSQFNFSSRNGGGQAGGDNLKTESN